MSDDNNPNRTVFRPSPLQGLRPPGSAPEPAAPGFPPPAGDPFAAAPRRLPDDDIPRPALAPRMRNVMMANAARILALAASVRSGRARIDPPRLHAEATAAITAFDQAVVAAGYPDEQRQRGKYALCATIDDIAQNLPGNPADGAEWARRSLVVQFFQEAIGGDRFWQLVDDMLARPAQYADLIELYHACLAAGFEGRFRVMPDGKRRLHEVMISLYAALDHVRTLSPVELSPHWRGSPTPQRRVGFWSILGLAAGIALGVLLVIYILLRLVLMETGRPAMDALRAINPDQPLRLSRVAPPPPPSTSGQLQTLRTFLAPEIAQHLVAVEEDGSTVRVRTTVGQLFQSGSDQLDAARKPLFDRIAAAIETQPGAVKVEGYTDSDRVRTLTFPDNIALSKARADAVAAIIRQKLSNGSRVTSEGFGESRPVAPNSTPQGKTLNRRVEIVVPRNS
ncbi:MAG TPA: type VI secretion system protein TssL, long form [Caulobacteraceae bacterium]|nr:type VI secretion system protein TssL, long form [Caulobacteraceae bacterium]